MVVLAADRSRMDFLTVNQDDELMWGLVSFNAHVSFSHGTEQPAVKHILAVRRKVVRHFGSALRPERQAFHVPLLRDFGADRICCRSRDHVFVADRESAYTYRTGEVALEQQ